MLQLLNLQNVPTTFVVLGITVSLYYISLGIWRLYFSPIAKFPGPKLAALTYWYEFYYDIILGGQYTFQVRRLHEKYGPIIRINPHELHVLDSDYFDTVYAGSSQKRNRDPWHTAALAVDDSLLGTTHHDLHRKRRAALNPFFSKQSARRLAPLIQERVETLIQRLVDLKDTGTVVNILHALSAFSNGKFLSYLREIDSDGADVITEYCFGNSEHRIEADGFDPSYYNTSFETAKATVFMRHFPFIPKMVMSLPESIAVNMGSISQFFIQKVVCVSFPTQHTAQLTMFQILRRQIEEVRTPGAKSKIDRQTIFHALLESDLPASEKRTERLIDEGIVVVGAGSHTVAWCLTVATFHVLSNPSILRKLKQELKTARTDNGLDPQELEKLPYLTAVIKEGLRLSYGATIRSPRSAPDTILRYKEWSIPAGTPVSLGILHIHHDENIFLDSHAFKPERWLEDETGRLDKYMVAFNGGSFMCIGINLAWAELYTCLALLFDTFGGREYREEGDKGILELFETDIGDVRCVRDLFFPVVRDGSLGVRVKISS